MNGTNSAVMNGANRPIQSSTLNTSKVIIPMNQVGMKSMDFFPRKPTKAARETSDCFRWLSSAFPALRFAKPGFRLHLFCFAIICSV